MTALTSGTMSLQGMALTVLGRRAVAEFITGRAPAGGHAGTAIGGCGSTTAYQRPVRCFTNHPTSASEACVRSSAVRNP